MAGVINRSLLKSCSGEFNLESIHTVCLKDQDVCDLGCIGECSSLERLDLSFNGICRLHRLAGLENLQYLNLAANRITDLEGLQALDKLEKLNLSGNLIGGIDSLRCLTGLEKLTDLRLQDTMRGLSNPVCMNSSYLADVRNMFPNLITLDGERLKGKGSEVFKLLWEIDGAIASKSEDLGTKEYSTDSWVPEQYWEPSKKFEQSMLGDAQQQLEDLLSSCRRLSTTADEKLQDLQTQS